MPGFADKALDHRKPRHLAWGSVRILESKSESCSGIDLELVLLETLTILSLLRRRPCSDEKSEIMTPWASAIEVEDAMALEAVCCCVTRTTLFTRNSICRCTSSYEKLYSHKVSYL